MISDSTLWLIFIGFYTIFPLRFISGFIVRPRDKNTEV